MKLLGVFYIDTYYYNEYVNKCCWWGSFFVEKGIKIVYNIFKYWKEIKWKKKRVTKEFCI